MKTTSNALPRELSIIADLWAVIDNAEWYFEDERANNCCGGACDCYENHKYDMAQAHAELEKMGLKYVDGEIYDMTGQHS